MSITLNKERRLLRRRNYIAKELNSNPLYQHRVFRDKRKHLIDELHEHDAEEDLYDFFGLGKAPKE